MKNIFTHTIIISIFTLSLLSCEKETPVGPNLQDLFGPFRITDSLSHNQADGIDFTSEENVQFLGNWSTITDWKLEIIGKTSGAVKTLTGKSKTLDTLLGQWNGTADNIFFKQEECNVILSFINNPDTMRTTITISELYDYSNDGIILQNFEGAGSIEFWGGNGNSIKKATKDDAPESGNYYYMEGTEPGGAYWIGSFTPFNALSIVGDSHFPFNDLDTATTYINFFVRGHGYSATFVNLQTKIDDNNDGTYSDTEGSFSYRYPVTGTNWQKVSIPLSNLTSDANSSIRLSEISKISTIYIMLFSDGVANPILGCDIDFIILTQGKPL